MSSRTPKPVPMGCGLYGYVQSRAAFTRCNTPTTLRETASTFCVSQTVPVSASLRLPASDAELNIRYARTASRTVMKILMGIKSEGIVVPF